MHFELIFFSPFHNLFVYFVNQLKILIHVQYTVIVINVKQIYQNCNNSVSIQSAL
ncbi:MAG: hypothetical protein E7309_00580 [Butyrivibrio sp.]|nr:hypothetical protein [Butyrivibrio sp.]